MKRFIKVITLILAFGAGMAACNGLTKMIKREEGYRTACKIERTMEALSGTDFTVVDNGDGTFTVTHLN